MPANWVVDDDVNGIFNAVQEHVEANIIDIWTKAEQKIYPVLASFEAKSEDDGEGRGFITRVGISTGTSVNPSFSVAQAKAAGTTTGNAAITGRWVSHAKTLEIVAQWTRKSMNVARGEPSGKEVYDVISREKEAKIVVARHRLAVAAIEGGTGRYATITSINSSELWFYVAKSEVNRFRKGDDVVFSATEFANTLRSATAWTVSGTDPGSGKITIEAQGGGEDPYDTHAVRTGDTVFLSGYRENSNTPTRLLPPGLKGWIPGTAPTDTTWDEQDRRYQWELNGLRIDASSGSQLDHASAFLEMSSMANQYGTELHAIYCSVEDYKILCRNKDQIKTLSQYTAGPYNVGFKGVEVLGGSNGSVPVIPDAYITQGTAWGGPWNDADFGPKLKHVRQLINVDNADGNEFLRLASSTGYEQRMYFEGAMIIPAPGKYVVCTALPTS